MIKIDKIGHNYKSIATVISAFPALGKSYIAGNTDNKDFIIMDSDSSLFSWKYDCCGKVSKEIKADNTLKHVRNSAFPTNYIDYISANLTHADLIFVSSHKEVRSALRERGIHFYVAVPELSEEMKDHMIDRMTKRGNIASFIQDQNDHYFERVREMISEVPDINRLITIHPDEYLSDVIKFISPIKNLTGTYPMENI